MADKKLKFDLDIAAKDAQKSLKDTASAAQDLSSDLVDTKSKGQAVAEALKAIADEAEVQLGEAQTAAQALGMALGPEMVTKIEQGGGSLDGLVTKLKSTGLTYDEIAVDADELAAAVKRIDEVSTSNARGEAQSLGASLDATKGDANELGAALDATGIDARELRQRLGTVDDVKMDSVRGQVRGIADEADRSKGVMANFAGNASQDIGQLAGVTGSAGVALGQFAEYATEGDIKLKGLVSSLGPMIAVAGAVEVFNMRLGQAAKADAWDKSRVEAYTSKIREGTSALQAFEEVARDTKEIFAQMPSSVFGDGMVDIIPKLAELKLSFDSFKLLVGGSREELDAWRETMVEAGADTTSVGLIFIAAIQEQERLKAGVDGTALALQVFTSETDRQRDAVLKASAAQRDFERDLRGVNAAYDDLGGTTQEQIDKNADHFRKLGEVDGKYDDVAGAADDYRDAMQELNEKYDDVHGKADEATRDLQELGEEYDKLTGKWSAREDWLGVLDQLDDFKEKVDSGELSWRELEQASIDTAQALAEYTEAADHIPTEVKSKILAEIDKGNFDLAEQLLTQLSRRRNVPLVPVVAGSREGRASGGRVNAGQAYVVGENRPELFVPDSNGTILPSVPPAAALTGVGAGPGLTVNLNGTFIGVEGPAVQRWIVGAIKDYKRRGGQL